MFPYKKPKRGDVIVFIYPKDPSNDFIKRVIGMPGETVQIIGGKVYIDNKLIPDSWGHIGKIKPPSFVTLVENSVLSQSPIILCLSWATTATIARTVDSGEISPSRTYWERPSSFTFHGMARLKIYWARSGGRGLENRSINWFDAPFVLLSQ